LRRHAEDGGGENRQATTSGIERTIVAMTPLRAGWKQRNKQLFYQEGHSAAEPQAKKKDNLHHKGREEHEVGRRFDGQNDPNPS